MALRLARVYDWEPGDGEVTFDEVHHRTGPNRVMRVRFSVRLQRHAMRRRHKTVGSGSHWNTWCKLESYFLTHMKSTILS